MESMAEPEETENGYTVATNLKKRVLLRGRTRACLKETLLRLRVFNSSICQKNVSLIWDFAKKKKKTESQLYCQKNRII